MRKLGISVFPQHVALEESLEYIETAAKYGFSRIFTCLISANDEAEFAKLETICKRAKELGFDVIADVDPTVFESLNITYKELDRFKELGLAGLRLDLGFSGSEEAAMSFDDTDLKIELNISNGTRYVENILSYQANVGNIIGCHNFYPRKYTGLSREHFLRTSKQFKDLNLRTAAFVSSNSGEFGPWFVVDGGLPTMEEHRGVDITVQAKDLWNTGLIDDVIVGNMFASEDELRALSELNRNELQLAVEFLDGATDVEKEIVLTQKHFNRGDASEYVLRSTMTRVNFKQFDFPAHDTNTISKGDVTIDNDGYERYKGEMQVALQEMEKSGNTNIVARIVPEERYLLDTILPWQHFRLVEKKK
ncbi:DUF871 domain-containing protein [Listeria monocytogenes]|uniref:DUF871 domain-containing protein n=1 Tax=Listeria monocytogenes TaxID=1639 RepID=UPI0010B97CF3|nr:DUF871 domain-containing protein [Listeria monocytogenes]EAC3929178.1 DUF871 domain-containing protein [Listeria monocytogenes]EAD1574721.1 DUF871 domain-containing protein [Listeria monocytogenes]EFM3068847.1 DUF871 domain-containing protein [Listeria monocytogenes]EFM3069244.1 DUF871 domain-containing protein [Listeria monocytogenes]